VEMWSSQDKVELGRLALESVLCVTDQFSWMRSASDEALLYIMCLFSHKLKHTTMDTMHNLVPVTVI
jgi:hypothetical protein